MIASDQSPVVSLEAARGRALPVADLLSALDRLSTMQQRLSSAYETLDIAMDQLDADDDHTALGALRWLLNDFSTDISDLGRGLRALTEGEPRTSPALHHLHSAR